ncbi:hypothetical protein [Pararhizobium sp. O133]|uniref:hypothetical protein n=1 Tax=Pararhizobium sp. O133 TaxID=3449278 RepID=UPI003F685BC0
MNPHYVRRPSGMMKHVVTKVVTVPPEKEDLIKADFLHGLSIRDITDRRKLPYNAVRNLIWSFGREWREEERFARIKPDERKIVIPRTFLEFGTYRLVPCSLPRISMHVAALEERA